MAQKKDEIWRGKTGQGASWLAAAILLALLAAALAAYRGGTGLDMVRRFLRYGTSERADGEILYDFEVSGQNRFALLGDYLAVLSDTELRVTDSTGGTLWSLPVHMANPALTEGGGRAAAYDVGGTELYVLDAGGVIRSIPGSEEEPYLSARLNRNGYLAVTAGARGKRGTVTVYDGNLEQLFRFNSSRRFVTDAFVTDDNLRMAAATLGQEDGAFSTEVVLYRLENEQPEAEYDIPDGLAVAAAQKGQVLTTVTDTCLSFARTDGTVLGTWPYGGKHLRGCDLGGGGFTVLLLNEYQSGNMGRLVTVDSEGRELGSKDLKEELLSLSAAGKYVAALYSGRLVVYNQTLQEYATLNNTDSVRQVIAREDGSILLIGADEARLFLP